MLNDQSINQYWHIKVILVVRLINGNSQESNFIFLKTAINSISLVVTNHADPLWDDEPILHMRRSCQQRSGLNAESTPNADLTPNADSTPNTEITFSCKHPLEGWLIFPTPPDWVTSKKTVMAKFWELWGGNFGENFRFWEKNHSIVLTTCPCCFGLFFWFWNRIYFFSIGLSDVDFLQRLSDFKEIIFGAKKHKTFPN